MMTPRYALPVLCFVLLAVGGAILWAQVAAPSGSQPSRLATIAQQAVARPVRVPTQQYVTPKKTGVAKPTGAGEAAPTTDPQQTPIVDNAAPAAPPQQQQQIDLFEAARNGAGNPSALPRIASGTSSVPPPSAVAPPVNRVSLPKRSSLPLPLPAVPPSLGTARFPISPRAPTSAASPSDVPDKAEQPSGASGKKETIVTTYALQMSQEKTAEGNLQILKDNVEIKTKDATFLTDAARYNETTGVAVAPGRIQLDDAQNTIIGDTGTAYYKRRDAVIKGNVTITVRPKPEDANKPEGSSRREFKEPVIITCDLVQYNWRTRKAILTGNLLFRQDKAQRSATADKALWDGKTETLLLIGNVKYRRVKPAQSLDGPEVELVLKEGAEFYRATSKVAGQPSGKRVTAVFPVEEDEEESGGVAPPAPTDKRNSDGAKPGPATANAPKPTNGDGGRKE